MRGECININLYHLLLYLELIIFQIIEYYIQILFQNIIAYNEIITCI